MRSFILMHPTVWPQYTKLTDMTDRQTDRLRSDSIGRIVLQTVAQKCAKAFGHDGATYAVRQNQLSHIHVIHRTRKTVERLEVR